MPFFNFVNEKKFYTIFSQLKLIEESLLYLAGWYLISSVADPEPIRIQILLSSSKNSKKILIPAVL
jgi:hypothetical protein